MADKKEVGGIEAVVMDKFEIEAVLEATKKFVAGFNVMRVGYEELTKALEKLSKDKPEGIYIPLADLKDPRLPEVVAEYVRTRQQEA